MPKKGVGKPPAPMEDWGAQEDPDNPGGDKITFADWLAKQGGSTPLVPDFGQDDPKWHPSDERIHPDTRVDPSITHDPKDAPVPVELFNDEHFAPYTMKEAIETIEALYGKGARSVLRFNTPLVMPRSGGPLIHTSPLPTYKGPLINVPTSGVPRSGPLVTGLGLGQAPTGTLSLQDLLAKKAQMQAQAHGHPIVASRLAA